VPDLLGDIGGAAGWCLVGVAEGLACFFGLAAGLLVCLLFPLVPPP
jgi:hypothetical protein